MKFIQGQNRNQITLFPISLESSIDEYSEVRLIDLFVDSLHMGDMGFKVDFVEDGRPAYNPKDLLKLYIYGYLNRTRSSRELEKETKRNIEVIWLLKGLSPDHNTISNFRRDNPKSIKKVFRATVQIAKNFNLIGGKLIAGDGTKFRAQNSKKNNYNKKKIDRHLAYIDNKLKQYDDQLSEADNDKQKLIKEEIEKHKNRREGYEQLQNKLDKTGAKQISITDPDSRHMITRGVITEVAYNAQSTVDAKHNLPIDYEVTNTTDINAMSTMVENAIEIVGNKKFDALFDKGYYNAEQINTCHKLGIETYVAIPAPGSTAPNKAYNLSEFKYNKEADTFTCPNGQTLRTNGKWYQKKTSRVKQYKTSHCKICNVKAQCTSSKSQRLIEKHEFYEALVKNRKALEKHPEKYKQRQAIVEHPFGTMKRQWGFDHIMTKKTIERASADVGLIFTVYSLRRIFNILGFSLLQEFLRMLVFFINTIFNAVKLKKLNFTPLYISANFTMQKKIIV